MSKTRGGRRGGTTPADVVAKVLHRKHAYRNKRVSGDQWKWYSPVHTATAAMALREKLVRALERGGFSGVVVNVSRASEKALQREKDYRSAVRKAKRQKKALPYLSHFGLGFLSRRMDSVRIIVSRAS